VSGDAAGLARGLEVVLSARGSGTAAERYPDEAPDLPPRSRGVIALFEENCTVCMLCARECPDWCIYIDSHTEVVPPATPRARPRSRHVLDRFAIDFALCMYCGICVEVCPFDALFWSPEFEYAGGGPGALTAEREQLREWMWTVPPPPAHDPAGEPAKEVLAAGGAGSGAAGGARSGAAPGTPT
jgi:NADH-quinone oxidoreductase subunit I